MMAGNDDYVCSHCGYSLLGLGRRGTCPECGQAFDLYERTGVELVGGAATGGTRGDRLVARLRTIFLGLIAVAILICGGLMSLIANNPMRAIAVAGVIAALFVMATITSFLYEKGD